MTDTEKTVIVSASEIASHLDTNLIGVLNLAACGEIPRPDARIINRPGNYWTLANIRAWRPGIADAIEKRLQAQLAA